MAAAIELYETGSAPAQTGEAVGHWRRAALAEGVAKAEGEEPEGGARWLW